MVLTVFYEPISAPCRSIFALLELAKIPYEKKVISFFKGECSGPEYLKINPLGLVPAIQDDDGFVVSEHEAILRYLVNTRKEAESFIPKDAKTKVLVDQYYPFHHYAVRKHIAHYFFGHNSVIPAESFNRETAYKDVEETLKKFESIFLQDKKFICEEDLTIADLSAANEFFQLYIATDFELEKKFPRVKVYMERCLLENPAVRETTRPIVEFAGKAWN